MAIVVTHNKVSAVPDDPAAVAAGEVVPSDWNSNHTVTGAEPALGNPASDGFVLASTAVGVRSWVAPGSGGMVYPGVGVAVSTGAAWDVSKATPAGAIVGTTDTQVLTNKTINDLTNYVDADAVHFKVYNNSGGVLAIGTPVYAVQWNVGSGAVEVGKALATSMATMPAIGLIETTVADGGVGEARAVGTLNGVNTNIWSEPAALYVSDSVAGTLTSTRPTAAGSLVQRIGTVVRQSATVGVIAVQGAGVVNDTPNTIPNGTIATTQAAADNSTKLATTAYVDGKTYTDTTTGNVSTAAHGLFPKLPTPTGLFLKDDLTWAAVGGGSGTVTSVTAGNGMTQSGTASVNPTLDVVSHAGSAGTIGTINIGVDAIGVNLGSTSTTACSGADARLSDSRTPTAHVLDSATHTISGKTGGQILLATAATTYGFTTVSGDGTMSAAGALAVTKINSVSLAGLATGILKNTTATGAPSIAVNTDLPAMSATVGGAVPTPPNVVTQFLNGQGGWTVPAGTYSLPTATNTVLGGVKPDGTSILNTAGVISATASSVGAAAVGSTFNLGTTALALNRVSAATALTGITSIDGSAASVANALTITTGNGLNGTVTSYNGSAAVTVSHLGTDGNLHVPATGTTNNGKVLTAGASAGVLTWTALAGGGDMLSTNNLSDVANAVTARNNILPSKTGNSLKVLRVNAGETDYEVATASAGAAGMTGGSPYLFDTSTGGSPATGNIQFNSATPASITIVYIYETDNLGVNVDWRLDNVDGGDIIKVYSLDNATKYHVFQCRGEFASGASIDPIPVTYLYGTGAVFSAGEKVAFMIDSTNMSSIGLNQVMPTCNYMF